MRKSDAQPVTEAADVRELALPLQCDADLAPLLRHIGDARHVLIGEASHGTSEFHQWRASLTRRLITEGDFSFIGVEGDWPDCFRIDRWVKGADARERGPRDVLQRFERWPAWMWANDEVAEFADWLRDHNDAQERKVGFYGLDVYSLWESMGAVMAYLAEHRPDALEAAYRAFRCFEPYDEDPHQYAWATRMVPASCEEEVVDLLTELRRSAPSGTGDDADLDARMNAEIVLDAERYYRTMIRADVESWNIRDTHMVNTMDRLLEWYGPGSRSVTWAHNTHVGDARVTSMAAQGMVNVGQLVRERHGSEGVGLVGFGTYTGSVVAGGYWGAPTRVMPVPAARVGSHEALIHDTVHDDHLFLFPAERRSPWLRAGRGHRAIGVVYDPAREHAGNYEPTLIGRRYDAFLYLDETHALHPIQPATTRVAAEEQDTYPWGR